MTLETTRTAIDRGWHVREIPQPGIPPTLQLPPLPAQVPGHVHLDLQRAGVIPDPFVRLHERDVAWVDDTDWVYETTFTLDEPPSGETFLVFHGLDTVAEIALNGEPLGQTDNMFIRHELPVGEHLRTGENTVTVILRSARRIGLERLKAWEEAGKDTMPHHYDRWSSRSFVRKAQYMFGWDWGPVLISCGIWRPVELVTVPGARLGDWRYDVRFEEDGRATVTIEAAVVRAAERRDIPLTLSATLQDGAGSEQAEVPEGEGSVPVSLTLTVENPRRWNPNGSGEGPFLYTLDLSLQSEETAVDAKQARIGLRTVELLHEPDPDGQGEGFTFRVNGQDLFCKGANWIPADSFPSRAYDESSPILRQLVTAARDAGFNMLRVWGGGLYESDHFYDLCDELGILVWQDFPYACAYYPDEDEYQEASRAEAEAAVRRLRVHPSLALWCGNNENQQAYHDNWNGLNPPRFLGERLYESVLPQVVAQEDPGRPYWPGSAYGGENPNSPDFGDRHNWDVWHGGAGLGDWPGYREDRSRFCSEFGFAASCGLADWDSCLAETDRTLDSSAVIWHFKTGKPYEEYLGYIQRHFPAPESLEDLVYYSQLNQAEALKCGVEHYRRLKGRCWGTLFWQINDCWPVQSWAVIDSRGEQKAAYYAARRFYAPVLLSMVEQDGEVEVHLTNDLLEPVSGELTLTLFSFDGARLHEGASSASIGPNATGKVATLSLERLQDRTAEMYLHASLTGSDGTTSAQNILFLAEPKDLQMNDPGVTATVHESEEGLAVRVSAWRFAPYVWISAPGLEPLLWEDNFFHLRPGETRTIAVRSHGAQLSVGDIAGRLAVRTLYRG